MTPKHPSHSAALKYAARGWRVIPLEGKLPLTKHAYKDGSIDPATIDEWWRRWSKANVGIVVGAESDLCVVDIDPRAGGSREALGQVPDTLSVNTGVGGTHLYFRFHPRARRRTVSPGIELKATGGYVVAPPSVHPETLQPYRWSEGTTEVAPLPEILLNVTPPTGKRRVTGPIREGERNQVLMSMAGAFRRKGGSYEGILAAIRAENETRCEPPLDDSEVGRIARSACRYAPESEAPRGANGRPNNEDADRSAEAIVTDHERADAGNADRLLEAYPGEIRYSPATGWLIWCGTHWQQDSEGAVQDRLIQVMRRVYQEAGRDEGDKALANHALRSLQEPRIRGALALAKGRPGVRIEASELDSDPWLLNCHNGTLDVRTAELRSHSRADHITRVLPTPYDPDAPCPAWLAFLQRVMDGNSELIQFLRQGLGYSLTGSTREQRLYLLHGTGANGKTTFLETARTLLGDYAAATPFETLLASDHGTATHDFARLGGARFVEAVEAEPGKRLAEAVVKHATGGDTIVARFLYREQFEYRPQFKLWLACNHRPAIRSTGEAFWRRIWLVPFSITIPAEERNLDLEDKLAKELPGILAWTVRGCFAWREVGMLVPKEVTAATAEYRADQDWLQDFLREECDRGPDKSSPAAALFAAYKPWAERRNERVLSQTGFGNVLREAGFRREHTRQGAVWHGLQTARR